MSSSWRHVKSIEQARAQCGACRHYFITHDPLHPYGCKVLGFKSKRTPALDVREASGTDCQSWQERAQPSVRRH